MSLNVLLLPSTASLLPAEDVSSLQKCPHFSALPLHSVPPSLSLQDTSDVFHTHAHLSLPTTHTHLHAVRTQCHRG